MTVAEIEAAGAWRDLGLPDGEYRAIVSALGRPPNWTELNMFSVLWSEHCAYKHSRRILKTLPTEGPQVLLGPGENAGVVDVGDPRLAVAIRIESHNHPSFVEPYQGAATGVGGILRDVLAAGARPVALLDSLRFGPLDDPRNRYLMGGVVAGIAGYGNCVGVPTVAGEVAFDAAYSLNPLVNVMCVGHLRRDRVARARAAGPGNAVLLVGAFTGRDGIHGASFASEELSEDSDERRPQVQVGDPFMEKKLIEACLELLERGLVVGIQDMGAAGITSSTAETAARAGTGMELDLDQVPLREPGMDATEILLSESQERMLVVVEPDRVPEVRAVCDRWELNAAVIGRVNGDGILRVRHGGRVVAEVPARLLAEGAPAYDPPAAEPAYLKETRRFSPARLPRPAAGDHLRNLQALLASPAIASKAWVYRQYDHMVRTDTALWPGAADAAVLRMKGSDRAIALKVDGNGRYCYLDPVTGGAIAVAEAARNVVAAGARPLAITNCLNFGNPEKPEIMWQFRGVVEGMARACRVLGTPVTGGNVSFYNETAGRAVYPTPVVGMLGVLESLAHRTTMGFKAPGDLVVLLGETRDELGGSEYLRVVHGLVAGEPPALDLDLERRVQGACLEAIRAGLVRSAHDCSDGGLAVALAECCFTASPGARGVHVKLAPGTARDLRPDALLFGESQSRIVLSLDVSDLPALMRVAEGWGVPAQVLGRVQPDRYTFAVTGGRPGRTTQEVLVDVAVAELERGWRDCIPSLMA